MNKKTRHKNVMYRKKNMTKLHMYLHINTYKCTCMSKWAKTESLQYCVGMCKHEYSDIHMVNDRRWFS